MERNWRVVIGKFYYDYGVYFNNKFVVNGKPDWHFEEDTDYYATIREINDETIEVLSYVKQTLQDD